MAQGQRGWRKDAGELLLIFVPAPSSFHLIVFFFFFSFFLLFYYSSFVLSLGCFSSTVAVHARAIKGVWKKRDVELPTSQCAFYMRVGNHHSYSHDLHVTRNGFFFFFCQVVLTSYKRKRATKTSGTKSFFFFPSKCWSVYCSLSVFPWVKMMRQRAKSVK